MGILDIHFHDSEFSWTFSPGTDGERSFSLSTGSGSSGRTAESGSAVTSKLRPVAMLALLVGAGIAFGRLRSRRTREAVEAESEGRGLSLSRSR